MLLFIDQSPARSGVVAPVSESWTFSASKTLTKTGEQRHFRNSCDSHCLENLEMSGNFADVRGTSAGIFAKN